MIKGKISKFLIHPVFLCLIIWGVLVLIIPLNFSKYRVKHIKDEYTPGKTSYFYCDLDSDGNSEKISFDLNDKEQTKIVVSKNDKIFDQYDLHYQILENEPVYTDDYNNDRFKECYVFTMSQDSIFLNIIDPIRSRKTILSNRFIDFRRKAQNSADTPLIEPLGMVEGQQSKRFSDFVFYINTGYSKQPRNVYRYLINEDSLIKSPESGAVISRCLFSDINGDSLTEILIDVLAPGNMDETFPFTDQFSWFMVLDNNLRFLFPPIKFGDNPSLVQVLPIQYKNQINLLVFYEYFGSNDIQSYFYLYDSKGNKIKEKPIHNYESNIARIFPSMDEDKQTFYFLMNRNTEIVELNNSFQVVRTIKIPEIKTGEPLGELDADLDGKKELIFTGINRRTLIFVQGDFKSPVVWQYNSDEDILAFSQFLKSGEKPILYVQFRDHGRYIRYEKNSFYFLRSPCYIAIYFALYLLVSVIGRIQRYRLNMKKESEMKMVSLQMKAIKNQIDPHFTLNVLNAIGSLYLDENNREKADYIFGKYAKLIRQTVISSDQIAVPIEEELDFVKNYIEIERFRCSNSFSYSINADKNSDMQTKIPRMLIHTFVENAIKYGIRNRMESGILNISIQTFDNSLNIIIEDNGTGFEQKNQSIKGTGKGLSILQELIDLYYKLENVKITYTLQNIQGDANTIAGTKALITVPFK